MKNVFKFLILSSLVAFLSCNTNKAMKDQSSGVNTLSKAEEKAGWKLLFDGQSLKGWHGFRKSTLSPDWKVEDGAITLAATYKADKTRQYKDLQSDLVTDGEFGNFELQMEWKISPCGNSGIIYRSVESDKYGATYVTGPEMQVLDDNCHPDAKIEKHRSSDLYDLVTATPRRLKPVGEWNQVRVVLKDDNVQHWLNGEKVVDVKMWTSEWDQMVQKSKWKEHAAYFAKSKKGHIALQDHDNPVWFRNIKIRAL